MQPELLEIIRWLKGLHWMMFLCWLILMAIYLKLK